MAAVPGL